MLGCAFQTLGAQPAKLHRLCHQYSAAGLLTGENPSTGSIHPECVRKVGVSRLSRCISTNVILTLRYGPVKASVVGLNGGGQGRSPAPGAGGA